MMLSKGMVAVAGSRAALRLHPRFVCCLGNTSPSFSCLRRTFVVYDFQYWLQEAMISAIEAEAHL